MSGLGGSFVSGLGTGLGLALATVVVILIATWAGSDILKTAAGLPGRTM